MQTELNYLITLLHLLLKSIVRSTEISALLYLN